MAKKINTKIVEDTKLTPSEEEKNPKVVDVDETEEEEEVDNDPIDIIITNDPKGTLIDRIYVRQYSLEVHGKDYKNLARDFCSKRPKGNRGTYLAVSASNIGKLEVRFREKRDADLHIDKQDPNEPIVDKVVVFDNKEEAVRLGAKKYDSTVIVSRNK